MTGVYVLAGFVWVLLLLLRRRRAARRNDVLIGAGDSRDYRGMGGGF